MAHTPRPIPATCTCPEPLPMWSPAPCNEDGWRCDNCHAVLGFRPDLDRTHLLEKVDALQFWMHMHELIYLSNSTMGEIATANVAQRCITLDRYDQYTIIREIMTEPNISSERHGDFWAEQARKALAGQQT